MSNEKIFDLDEHIVGLLSDEPFFAAISRHVDKRASKEVPTAGVRVTSEGHYELAYNPEWMGKLTYKQRRGILKHEFYHLVFEHVTTRLPDTGMTKLWNIATDLAINTHIADEVPEGGCVPSRGKFVDMREKQSSEYYYAELLKKQEENEDGEGDDFGDTLDDHEGWGENAENIDPSVRDIAKQRLKEMMKEAAEESNKKNQWGSVSADVRQDIMKRISTKVDWRSVLRYFIKTSQRSDRNSTVKKLNKRFPYIHAGKKIRRHAKIAISIDQSGSVSDEMLVKFFAELNNLSKLATFTVIPFDCSLDEKLIYEWKKGTSHKTERVKFGGTDFNAPTEYVNAHAFDGHIILTDMCAPKPIASKCQRMWMTDEACANNPYFTTNERMLVVD
jgi:predicted metal-dependent peptidase